MANLPLASIPATEVRTLKSSAVDQEYLISVALPFHYEEQPERTYPVIYVVHGNLFFGMVVEMVRMMNTRISFSNKLPDTIIVGIGYPPNGSLAESWAQVKHLRMSDLSPERDEGFEQFIQMYFPVPDPVTSGGADRFLQFILQELVPLIEAEYRTDKTDRTLMCPSSGGGFALSTLFHQPHLFHRYVASTPDLNFGDEQKYAKPHDSLLVRMHLSFGEREAEHEIRTFHVNSN